jgi:membrane glycosyltransferase
VRVLPEAEESFEQAPETLAAHIRRDRRWCQGNLQHLRLLGVPGLHPVSRLHFVQGAMAYLSSLWWLALLVLFALAVPVDGTRDARLAAPLSHTGLAVAVVALLLAPRVVGVAERIWRGRPTWRVAPALVAELGISVLLAPVLMVQQAQAVLAALAGRDGGWGPHVTGRPGMRALLRLHRWETGLGLAVLGLVGLGLVTPWLAQIGVSLFLAAPLSWLVQQDAPGWLRASGGEQDAP